MGDSCNITSTRRYIHVFLEIKISFKHSVEKVALPGSCFESNRDKMMGIIHRKKIANALDVGPRRNERRRPKELHQNIGKFLRCNFFFFHQEIMWFCAGITSWYTTYWIWHKIPPSWWKKVTTSGRKNSH